MEYDTLQVDSISTELGYRNTGRRTERLFASREIMHHLGPWNCLDCGVKAQKKQAVLFFQHTPCGRHKPALIPCTCECEGASLLVLCFILRRNHPQFRVDPRLCEYPYNIATEMEKTYLQKAGSYKDVGRCWGGIFTRSRTPRIANSSLKLREMKQTSLGTSEGPAT